MWILRIYRKLVGAIYTKFMNVTKEIEFKSNLFYLLYVIIFYYIILLVAISLYYFFDFSLLYYFINGINNLLIPFYRFINYYCHPN